jgi:hypothetical protein
LKSTPQFLILSVALALNGNQLVLCKGNNSNNKMLKVYNFRIKSGIGNWSIYIFSSNAIYRYTSRRIRLKGDIVLSWDRQVLGEWNHLFFFTYEFRNFPFNIQYYITIILLDFNNKMLKVYNFRIKSGIGNWSIYIFSWNAIYRYPSRRGGPPLTWNPGSAPVNVIT